MLGPGISPISSKPARLAQERKRGKHRRERQKKFSCRGVVGGEGRTARFPHGRQLPPPEVVTGGVF
jgi:hypothetical protein